MRVATYNVHDCVGLDGRFDPERIAEVLVEINADVIALQEVTLDHAGSLIQRLESVTGFQGVDGGIFERGAGRYGNLLLTRFPVERGELRQLPSSDREPRGMIDVLLARSGMRVCATHLGLETRERREQIAELSRLLASGPQSALLMGDFNVWWRSTAFAPLTAAGFTHTEQRSFPVRPRPLFALDRILARSPIVIRQSWRHDSPLARISSDHYPVIAELKVPEQ